MLDIELGAAFDQVIDQAAIEHGRRRLEYIAAIGDGNDLVTFDRCFLDVFRFNFCQQIRVRNRCGIGCLAITGKLTEHDEDGEHDRSPDRGLRILWIH